MKNTFIAQSFGRSLNQTNIPNLLFKEYNVKKGLRNEDGTGVRVGLTKISDVVGYVIEDDKKVNIPGQLYYRGINLEELVAGRHDSLYGFEEMCFLILFGYLPNEKDLKNFSDCFNEGYNIPKDFLESNFLRNPSKNLMNLLQGAVLSLYSYDEDPDTVDPYQTLLKGINLLAKIPLIISYGYKAQMHYYNYESLVLHYPKTEYSIAENILSMIRDDGKFTISEAKLLDTILMLHADHGGGNNSTFTNVVISSTGTDIYSSTAGSIGSLKGPKHGGANIFCAEMMTQIISDIGYTKDEGKIREIIRRIIKRDYYDNSGLIYGMGHAVYTISDPRAEILRSFCKELAVEKNMTEEFEFYQRFEKIAKEMLFEKTKRDVSNNVDFYSGFAYQMLGIPREMYTPLFACSRMVGWLAHNIENKLYDGKIMRPATKYVGETQNYIEIGERGV